MSWRKRLAGIEIIVKKINFNGLKAKIKLKEPLKGYTTFKIGGPADFFIEPESPDSLKRVLGLLRRNNLPFFLLGRGSNLLIGDKGIRGAVLRLNAPYFNKLSYKNNSFEVGCGVLLNKLLTCASNRGLSGVEFLAGIPGTMGGALAMNAGVASKAQGSKIKTHSIGDTVEKVTVMDYYGRIKTLDKKDIKFGYRKSSLAKYIILSAKIRLAKADRKEIRDRIKEYMGYRKFTQDLTGPSAGCVFKNPAQDSAGRLIDSCGLKGKRIGGAGISLKHANFILNLGEASAGDVLKLMDFTTEKVKEKFGINLIPEIKIWR